MAGVMSAVWAWMSRPDVVLAVSILAIVLSLIALALESVRRKP
jgi:hypothetical protein